MCFLGTQSVMHTQGKTLRVLKEFKLLYVHGRKPWKINKMCDETLFLSFYSCVVWISQATWLKRNKKPPSRLIFTLKPTLSCWRIRTECTEEVMQSVWRYIYLFFSLKSIKYNHIWAFVRAHHDFICHWRVIQAPTPALWGNTDRDAVKFWVTEIVHWKMKILLNIPCFDIWMHVFWLITKWCDCEWTEQLGHSAKYFLQNERTSHRFGITWRLVNMTENFWFKGIPSVTNTLKTSKGCWKISFAFTEKFTLKYIFKQKTAI